MANKVDYRISGYAGAKHPQAAPNTLLLSTWHIGQSSRDMEIAAWRARMKRGEVSYITVTDVAAGVTETITAAE